MVILDTAGRLGVDEALMKELSAIDRKVGPDAAFLVADAMTGQDAVNSAKAFNEALELDGVVLTKMDGDTRGGAALSIKAVTGVPLKFVGTGETLDGLEAFHPDRMAGRILGGGDMATLLEKAQREFDADEMAEQQARMAEGKFTLLDFKKAMGQIGKLGSMRSVMKMIPGMGQLADMDPDADMDGEVRRVGAMIDSMTREEKLNPDRIDRSRRNRIADRGSGVQPHEVNKLLKDFKGMAGLMQSMAGMGMRDRMAAVNQGLAGQMSANPGGQLARKEAAVQARPGPSTASASSARRKRLSPKRPVASGTASRSRRDRSGGLRRGRSDGRAASTYTSDSSHFYPRLPRSHGRPYPYEAPRAHAPPVLPRLRDGLPRPAGRQAAIEEVGTYDPMVQDKAKRVKLDLERIDYWVGVGAQPSHKVGVLIKKVRKNDFGTAKAPPALTAPEGRGEARRRSPRRGDGRGAPAEDAPAEEASRRSDASRVPAATGVPPASVRRPHPRAKPRVVAPHGGRPPADTGTTHAFRRLHAVPAAVRRISLRKPARQGDRAGAGRRAAVGLPRPHAR